MSFITKLIASIGDFFSGLFKSSEKAYEELSEVEQKVSQQASGLVAIINANLEGAPAVIWNIIQEKYPELDKEKVTAALAKVGILLGILDNVFAGSFEDAVAAIQAYLSRLPSHNNWATMSKTIVALIADVLAPGTAIQKLELVLEYVYLNFIKGKVA